MPDRVPSHKGGLGVLPQGTIAADLGGSKREEIQSVWSTFEMVMQDLNKRGFSMPAQPQFSIPDVTDKDLLTEDNNRFTTMYAKLLSWHNYIKTTYAQVRATLIGYQNAMEDIAATTRKSVKEHNKKNPSEKLTAQDTEDEITTNPGYKNLKVSAQQLEQSKLILDALVDNIERSLRVVSRQVEINRQELDAENIKNNIHNRGNPPRGFTR